MSLTRYRVTVKKVLVSERPFLREYKFRFTVNKYRFLFFPSSSVSILVESISVSPLGFKFGQTERTAFANNLSTLLNTAKEEGARVTVKMEVDL